mmetsp:Transcript_15766/g.22508  ORF Transcript_15766/g.22508 Transcript_15766/m.22508 type:complete len:134 (+) Transcript_15766:90-491(+)
MSEESFFISLYSRLIRYFYPEIPQEQNNQATTTRRQRRNRSNHRRRNRLHGERINLNNNFRRAQIIIRARQITAHNREIARQAEQALIDAILQARGEFERRITVRNLLRTQNERPVRPLRETETVNHVVPENI